MICESNLCGDILVDPGQITSTLCALNFSFISQKILHNTCYTFLRAELRVLMQLKWKKTLYFVWKRLHYKYLLN